MASGMLIVVDKSTSEYLSTIVESSRKPIICTICFTQYVPPLGQEQTTTSDRSFFSMWSTLAFMMEAKPKFFK